MNKLYLKLIISSLISICIALGLYFISIDKNKNSPNNSKQATSTEKVIEENQSENNNVNDETEPTKPTLDLTKLQGKDRLYTEEEGKYENLSEEEKVLIETYHCRNYKWNCGQYIEINEAEVEGVRLVALKDGMMVIYGPSGAEMKGWLYIYNLVEQKLVAEIIDVGNIALGSDFIVYANLLGRNNELELYKPGMQDFINITDSKIDARPQTNIEISYLEYRDSHYHPILPIDFTGETITVYEHTYNYTAVESSFDEEGLYIPSFTKRDLISKVPKTFDISNLP